MKQPRLTKAYMQSREAAKRDEQIAAADAYYQTEAGQADRRDLYRKEFERIELLESIAAKLPAGWDSCDRLSDEKKREFAAIAECSEDDIVDLFYGEIDDLRKQVSR